jgi:hypothetical protein
VTVPPGFARAAAAGARCGGETEIEMIGNKVKIRDLRPGNMFDLAELDKSAPGGRYPLDEVTRMVAESELAVVIDDEGDGVPFTVESDETWVVHTDSGSFGVGPDWEVTLEGHDASYE